MVLPAAGSRRRQVAELAARGHSFNIRSKPALHNKRMSDTKPPKFRCAPAPVPVPAHVCCCRRRTVLISPAFPSAPRKSKRLNKIVRPPPAPTPLRGARLAAAGAAQAAALPPLVQLLQQHYLGGLAVSGPQCTSAPDLSLTGTARQNCRPCSQWALPNMTQDLTHRPQSADVAAFHLELIGAPNGQGKHSLLCI